MIKKNCILLILILYLAFRNGHIVAVLMNKTMLNIARHNADKHSCLKRLPVIGVQKSDAPIFFYSTQVWYCYRATYIKENRLQCPCPCLIIIDVFYPCNPIVIVFTATITQMGTYDLNKGSIVKINTVSTSAAKAVFSFMPIFNPVSLLFNVHLLKCTQFKIVG